VYVSPAAVVEIGQAGRRRRAKRPVDPGEHGVRLTLLGGFALRLGPSPVMLATGPQRVIAFIALHARPLRRGYVFGSLWPDAPEHRAAASLRSAIWRIQTRAPLLAASGDQLRLDEHVRVDFREASGDPMEIDRSLLALDLLPGWYDDWVLIERERWRQVRLRALEARCEALALAGRFGDALEVGLEALATDPLRESAHRALVRVHLAEGNVGEARRQYRLCERLLRQELGVAPSAQMHELVHGARA
jgi:DNA-binding SARP family transcriptional activator